MAPSKKKSEPDLTHQVAFSPDGRFLAFTSSIRAGQARVTLHEYRPR